MCQGSAVEGSRGDETWVGPRGWQGGIEVFLSHDEGTPRAQVPPPSFKGQTLGPCSLAGWGWHHWGISSEPHTQESGWAS